MGTPAVCARSTMAAVLRWVTSVLCLLLWIPTTTRAADRRALLFDSSRITSNCSSPPDCSVTVASASQGELHIQPSVGAETATIHVPALQRPWNLSDAASVQFGATNLGDQPAVLFAVMDGQRWSDTCAVLEPAETVTVVVPLFRFKLPPLMAARFPQMNGAPGGAMTLWTGAGGGTGSNAQCHSELTLSLGAAGVPAQPLSLSGLRWTPWNHSLGNGVPSPLSDAVYPFVDQFGQSKISDWPRKIHTGADFVLRRSDEEKDLAAHPGPSDWSVFGGDTSKPALAATGHFRTQKVDDRWWLVDPQGYRFFSHGIDCVGAPGGTSTVGSVRSKFFEAVPPGSDFRTANLRAKYGPGYVNASAVLIHKRLRSWGVNTIGNWANPSVFLPERPQRTSYVIGVNYHWPGKQTSPTDFVNDPQFAPAVHAALQAWADKGVDADPYLLGVFVDNELHSFNENETVAEIYFSTVHDAMRALLPHKLYLGCRLDYHFWPNDGSKAAVRAAAKYADVVSFNHYRYTAEQLRPPASGSSEEEWDAPVIIGEYHFGALDRGPFHTGLRSVGSQEQRARTYELFMRTALANEYLVGAHWFAYSDEPTTGRGDGENYQIGFVDEADTPYGETVNAARKVGAMLYSAGANCTGSFAGE